MRFNWANLITLGNLFCGVLAIGIGDPFTGSILILIGAIFDLFDGLVARMLQIEGALGAQLDSLADLITFGVAPALLYYQLRPDTIDFPFALIAITLLVGGTAYRLALFNTLPPSNEFSGLPSPASGLFFTGWVFAIEMEGTVIPGWHENEFLYLVLPLAFTILMNIRVPFFSAKNFSTRLPKGWPHYLLMLGVILLFILFPVDALALSILWYVFLAFVAFPMMRGKQ